jgi:hypothetical protein
MAWIPNLRGCVAGLGLVGRLLDELVRDRPAAGSLAASPLRHGQPRDSSRLDLGRIRLARGAPCPGSVRLDTVELAVSGLKPDSRLKNPVCEDAPRPALGTKEGCRCRDIRITTTAGVEDWTFCRAPQSVLPSDEPELRCKQAPSVSRRQAGWPRLRFQSDTTCKTPYFRERQSSVVSIKCRELPSFWGPNGDPEFLDMPKQLCAGAARERPAVRPVLRVKRVQGHPGVWEMTFPPDGRATFEYGAERRSGAPCGVAAGRGPLDPGEPLATPRWTPRA